MDFELDDEHRMLGQAAREFLGSECDKSVLRELEASASGHSPDLWKKMAGLGWMGIAIPEAYGGGGWGLLGLAVLCEEMGRAAFDGPLFAHSLAGLAVLEGGSEAQKRALLPAAASGERVWTLALGEAGVANDLRWVATPARRDEGGYTLQGVKLFVPYADVADEVLVLARTSGSPGSEAGLTLFRVEGRQPGLRSTALATIATDRQFQLELDGVRVPEQDVVGRPDEGCRVLRPVLQRGAALRCVDMVGGADHELQVTAEYTKQRVQFDRPIGTFQAVQHHLANMFTDVQGARWTSWQAVSRLARGLPAERELAIAKAFTSDACQRVAFQAQQLHGGAGVDLDHDLHFYYRRAKALELSFGSAPIQLRELEDQIGL